MNYTNDLATDVGKVRLPIPDVKPGKMRYSDEDITALLELEGRVPKRAAALALETMASSKADCIGYVQTNAITVDGTRPAQVLLGRAATLRAQVLVEEGDEIEFSDFGGDWRGELPLSRYWPLEEWR